MHKNKIRLELRMMRTRRRHGFIPAAIEASFTDPPSPRALGALLDASGIWLEHAISAARAADDRASISATKLSPQLGDDFDPFDLPDLGDVLAKLGRPR